MSGIGEIWRQRGVMGVATFSALLQLYGCGGGGDGGDGGQDLYVNYSFGTATLNLWEAGSYTPSIGGLNGKTPRCSVSSGGPLPAGLVFESTGCRIQGTPLDVAAWSGTISLTVDGYSGSLSSGAAIQVRRPRVTTPGSNGSLIVTWGTPFSMTAVTLVDFTVRPEDQITYTLLSALPNGVEFDGATGRLSGTATVTSQFLLTTQATISRAGRSVTTDPASIPIAVGGLSSLSYTECCNYVWAVPFQAQPRWQPTLPPGTTMTYAMATGDHVPPGMTLDPVTGVISGAPLEFNATDSWYWGATVVRTIVASTGETFTARHMMYPSIVIPRLYYGNRTGPAVHMRPNQPFNYGLPTYTDTLPGDVVSDFAVQESSPSPSPAPAWLQVNPTTGELVITPPPNPNPGPFPQPQWNQDYVVAYTITRNGIARRGRTGIGFYVDPL